MIRHDVADASYVVRDDAYPALVDLISRGDCIATLVHPRYLLTVAHCAMDVSAGAALNVNGTSYAIDEVLLHPSWRDRDDYDIALVRLATEVTGVTPMPLYRGSDEMGALLTIVGRGDTGTGLLGEGSATNDGLLRRANNVVTSVNAHFIEVRFERSSDSGVLPLEGVGAAGDSGCPAFIDVGGVPHVAGLNSYGEEGSAAEVAAYGSFDYQTRVSQYLDWIDGVIGPAPNPTDGKLTITLSPSSGAESAGAIGTGTVRIDAAAGADVVVALAVAPVGHLTPSPETVTIPVGATSATFDVAIVNDPPGAADADRTVRINATAAGHDPGAATFTVFDDDAPATGTRPTVRWTSTSLTVEEGARLVEVTAILSAPASAPVTVPVTIAGTATENEDFEIAGTTAQLTFVNRLEAVVSLVLIDDAEREPEETIVLTLGTPAGADLGAATIFALTIEDDDDPTEDSRGTVRPAPAAGCGCTTAERGERGLTGLFVLVLLAASPRRRRRPS